MSMELESPGSKKRNGQGLPSASSLTLISHHCSYSHRVVIALGGRFGGEYRRMTTYVNGRVCASINKGVLQAPDGRYASQREDFRHNLICYAGSGCHQNVYYYLEV